MCAADEIVPHPMPELPEVEEVVAFSDDGDDIAAHPWPEIDVAAFSDDDIVIEPHPWPEVEVLPEES